MLQIIINLLWLLVIAIACAGALYLIIYGINQYIHPLPPKVEGAIWFIFLLLVVIAILGLLAGGGLGSFHAPTIGVR